MGTAGRDRAAPPSAGKTMTEHTEATNDLVIHEEELVVGAEARESGSVVARKVVETERVREVLPTKVEQARVERVPANPEDSGELETLEDGTISIPVLEEQLVVTKRVVVRERIVIRKRTVTEATVVEDDLRRERLELETRDAADVHPAA